MQMNRTASTILFCLSSHSENSETKHVKSRSEVNKINKKNKLVKSLLWSYESLNWFRVLNLNILSTNLWDDGCKIEARLHERDSIVTTTGAPKRNKVFVVVCSRQRAQHSIGGGRRRRLVQNDSPLQKAAKAHCWANRVEVFCSTMQRTRTHAREVTTVLYTQAMNRQWSQMEITPGKNPRGVYSFSGGHFTWKDPSNPVNWNLMGLFRGHLPVTSLTVHSVPT